jgi:hypothetical protein
MSTAGLSVLEANNFMALESHLVELVRLAVAGMSPAVHVLTAAELGDVKESAQRTPAVHVIYGGYSVAEDLGTAWRLEHTWYAVAAVRNVGAQRTGAAARAEAGPLVVRVIGALAGARVPGATKPLQMVTPPKAGYATGFQYIPSAFLAETIFRKP